MGDCSKIIEQLLLFSYKIPIQRKHENPMIQPLTLGNRTFPVNLIQGPLAGISCAPFRRLVAQYGQSAFACSEMISCKTILHQSTQTLKRYLTKDPTEGPVCFQLSASEPHELAEAVKRVTDQGADLIDLNCGCPVKKIRAKGAGSRLLVQPTKLFQLIRAMKENTHVPVSIKIRVESPDEKFNREVAQVISDAGADFLIVHGRHWTQHYETPCRHDDIQFFVENVTIPVIGNGDVNDLVSLQKMFATGCQGVMIGRAGVGQPWLTKKLIAAMQQESFVPPSALEIATLFIQHVRELSILLANEKFALLQARQFAKYYARELPLRSEFCAALNQCDTLAELENITFHYFMV